MQRRTNFLKITRDMRVAGHTPARVWLTTSSTALAFASALRNRFARHTRFLSVDLSFLTSRALVALQRQVRNLNINLRPHVQLTSKYEKYYESLGRRTENRLLPPVGVPLKPAPAVERILQRQSFYANPQRTRSLSDELNVIAASQAELSVKRAAEDLFSLQLFRRAPASFAPIEMVKHEPRRETFVSDGPEKKTERQPPRIDLWPNEERPRSLATTDVINIKHLTDQVVELLDRRVIAGHERLARR